MSTSQNEPQPTSSDETPPGNGESEGAIANDNGDTSEADANVQPLSAEMTVELELAAAKAEAGEYREQLLRKAAELENFRRRATREREEARKYGIEALLRDVLPVIDNMERAVDHASKGGTDTAVSLLEGVEMVKRQFLDMLARHGVTTFESRGKPFDPNRHEGVHRVETDEHPPNTVIDEFQKGYLVHDRLVRPAMVSVSAAPKPERPDTDGGEDDAGSEADGAARAAEAALASASIMGITVEDATPRLSGPLGLPTGALVTDVRAQSAGQASGLEPGDVVTTVGGVTIGGADAMSDAVRAGLQSAQDVSVIYYRGGEPAVETRLGHIQA